MTKDELQAKLILAIEKYSAAGDEENSRQQYRNLHDEARAIITNDILGRLAIGDDIT